MKLFYLTLFVALCWAIEAPGQTIVFTEDFAHGMPDDWELNPISCGNPDSLANAVWTWALNETLVVNDYWIDYFHCQSPTAADGFAIFDASFLDSDGVASEDPPSAGTGSAPSPFDSELISPSIDCSDLSSVVLTFYQEVFRYEGNQYMIGISNDGGQTWNYIPINQQIDYLLGGTKDYNELVSVDLSEYAALEPDVRLSFRYEGGYYYWLVDDISVSDRPPHDLVLVDPVYPLTSYAQPAPQLALDTIRFEMRVGNIGTDTLANVVGKVEIQNPTGELLYTDSLVLESLAAEVEDSLLVLPGVYVPGDLQTGLYTIHYEVYTMGVDDFTPSNNRTEMPFELTTDRLSKHYGEYFGALGWLPGAYRIGNQYRTASNWTGGFIATKVVARLCCQPDMGNKTIPFRLYEVKPEIAEDWSNFDNSSDDDLILRGYGDYTISDETYQDDLEVTLYDGFTGEEGAELLPDRRYFIVAELQSSGIQDLAFQVSNKINYALRNNSTVFWSGGSNGVWFVFGSGTPNAGSFVPVMELELDMNVNTASGPSLPKNALRVAPNPVRDQMNIRIELPNSQDALLTLANAEGKIIVMKNLGWVTEEVLQLPVSHLPAGIYYLRLSTTNGSVTQKIVVTTH